MRSEYADLLLGIGEREQAVSVLREALAGAEACELASLAARCRARLD